MTQDETPRATGAGKVQLPLDFTAFHKLKRPVYIRYAFSFFHNLEEAEEAVDEAFLRLVQLWETKVLPSENPHAYAWRVMSNKVHDHYRTLKRRPASLGEAPFVTQALDEAEDPIAQFEESLALYHAVEQLPERQREVVILRFLQDESEQMVADTLGIAPASVRSMARYAKLRMAAYLAPNDPNEPKDDTP